MTIEISGTLTSPNNPRLCYNNLTKTATVTTSTAASGFAGTNTQNALTWNFWKPTALPATIEYNIGSSTSVNFCGIAAHNLGSSSCIVSVEKWNGSTWDVIDTQTPADDSPILFLFDSVSATKYRLNISDADTDAVMPSIGVVYFGQQLVMERPIYGGHSPITLSQKNVIRPQKSENGQWLGRTVVRQGAQTNIAFKNLTASFIRNSFKPFMESAINYPFFFAWRPTSYPAEVAYCWTAGDMQPSNQGQRDLMEVSFAIDAIID